MAEAADRWLSLFFLGVGLAVVFGALQYEPLVPFLGLVTALVAISVLTRTMAGSRALAGFALLLGFVLLEPLLPAQQRLEPSMARALYMSAGFLLVIVTAPRLRS